MYSPKKSVELLRAKVANYLRCSIEQVELKFGKYMIEDGEPLNYYTKNHEWIKIKVRVMEDVKGTQPIHDIFHSNMVQNLNQSSVNIDVEI